MRRFIIPLSCLVAFSAIISSLLLPIVLQKQDIHISEGPRVHVAQLYSTKDADQDGINDTQDILNGAREEVQRAPIYHSAYHQGGYPPAHEGVCTDVIWRAFSVAGYDLKKRIDQDIARHPADYPRVDGKPDPNIDFRRVPNMLAFFKKYAHSLPLEIKPGDETNLTEWQGGDIVVFGAPHEHIAIISDVRRRDGVPYIIHNSSPHPAEQDALILWHERASKIVGHFRWPK
jgi:uncharacterized protein YijF (DUF1287 family)